MRVSERRKQIVREFCIARLCFLQAQYIGGLLPQEAFDDVAAKPDRIDIPGSDAQRIGHDGALASRHARY
jgi:hypothetical protein